MRRLYGEKVEIIKAQACREHRHMLVSIPPYLNAAQFVGCLKNKRIRMILTGQAGLKYK